MNKKIVGLFVTAIICISPILAQEKWTLTECINYAHENNIDIKRSQFQASISEVDELQAKTNILPDLNASMGRGYGFGRSVDPYTNRFIYGRSVTDNFSLSSSISLFSGLQNYNNIKRTKFNTLAAISDIEKEKIEITFDISSAYLQILYQKELLEMTKSQKEVVGLQVNRTKRLVEAGSVAKGDLLEIGAQLASETLNVTEANNQLNLSYLNLAQLLDLDSVGNFDIVVPDTVEPDFLTDIPSLTMVYDDALAYLPHIKSAQYKVKSTESYLAMQKGARSPTLFIEGSVYTGYSNQRELIDADAAPVPTDIGYLASNNTERILTDIPVTIDYPYSDQINDNIAESFSVGLSIPILNRWEVNNNISKARIELEDSQSNLELVKQQLMKQIQQAHNDALSAKDKYNAANEAVVSYEEAFKYTEQKYNVGIVNSVEYNIAKNNYIRAESELVQAKYEYIFARKILDFYRGIPMEL